MKTATASDLMRAVKKSDRIDKTVQWHTVTLSVHPFLDFNDYMSLINNIVDMVTGEHGVAAPAIDFATRICIITYYALLELPENIEDQFYLVYGTDLYDTVCSAINKHQLESITRAVDRFFLEK